MGRSKSVFNKRSQDRVTSSVKTQPTKYVIQQAHAQPAPNPTTNRSVQSQPQQDPWARASQFAQNVGRGAGDTARSYTTDIADSITGNYQERKMKDQTLSDVFITGAMEGRLDDSWGEIGRRVTQEPGRVVGEAAVEAGFLIGTMGVSAAGKGLLVGKTAVQMNRAASKAKGIVGYEREIGIIKKGKEIKFIGDKTTETQKWSQKKGWSTKINKTKWTDRIERRTIPMGRKVFGNTKTASPMIRGGSGADSFIGPGLPSSSAMTPQPKGILELGGTLSRYTQDSEYGFKSIESNFFSNRSSELTNTLPKGEAGDGADSLINRYTQKVNANPNIKEGSEITRLVDETAKFASEPPRTHGDTFPMDRSTVNRSNENLIRKGIQEGESIKTIESKVDQNILSFETLNALNTNVKPMNVHQGYVVPQNTGLGTTVNFSGLNTSNQVSTVLPNMKQTIFKKNEIPFSPKEYQNTIIQSKLIGTGNQQGMGGLGEKSGINAYWNRQGRLGGKSELDYSSLAGKNKQKSGVSNELEHLTPHDYIVETQMDPGIKRFGAKPDAEVKRISAYRDDQKWYSIFKNQYDSGKLVAQKGVKPRKKLPKGIPEFKQTLGLTDTEYSNLGFQTNKKFKDAGAMNRFIRGQVNEVEYTGEEANSIFTKRNFEEAGSIDPRKGDLTPMDNLTREWRIAEPPGRPANVGPPTKSNSFPWQPRTQIDLNERRVGFQLGNVRSTVQSIGTVQARKRIGKPVKTRGVGIGSRGKKKAKKYTNQDLINLQFREIKSKGRGYTTPDKSYGKETTDGIFKLPSWYNL